jgi:hypothetical protein
LSHKSFAPTCGRLTAKEASSNTTMLTAINNALNDHQFMNALINGLAMFGMVSGLVALYLCITYPARRKR